jgi:hypothetical protein
MGPRFRGDDANEAWLRLAEMIAGFVWPKCGALSCPHAEEHRSATRVQILPLPNRAAMRTRVRVRRTVLACALLRMRRSIADDTVHHVKQPISFPRRTLRPGFCPFASLTPIEGWAERRETFGCVRGTRWARRNAARQALARRHASHDAGRSPLGAPPWRFWAPGAALLSPLPPSACASAGIGSDTASSSQPGHSAWQAASLPPETTVTSRRRRTPHLAPPSGSSLEDAPR